MGNEQSSNSKKSSSTYKKSNTTLSNNSAIYQNPKQISIITENDQYERISKIRKYFRSPKKDNQDYTSNLILKDNTKNFKILTKREKALHISQLLINKVPEALSDYLNVDIISSSFGLKSLENNEIFKKTRLHSFNKTGIRENLIEDHKLNFLIKKTQFDLREKTSEKSNLNGTDNNIDNTNNTCININDASCINNVAMDTSVSFFHILEEFEKLSTPEAGRKTENSNYTNELRSPINKKRVVNMIHNKKFASPNDSSEQESSTYIYNSNISQTNSHKKTVKNIPIKNNIKIVQTNRSKDNKEAARDERLNQHYERNDNISKRKGQVCQEHVSVIKQNNTTMNEKLNISTDQSDILRKTKNNLENKEKVKNIKINLNGKQKSTSPNKNVLNKIEPTLVIDLRRVSTPTIIKKYDDNYVHSPTDSTHLSQFDSQFNYNTTPELNKSNSSNSNKKKLDMNVIKVAPKILKKENPNQSTREESIYVYNTYSQLKKKSVSPVNRDTNNKVKKILNSSNISDDGENVSVNTGNLYTKYNQPISREKDSVNISGNKDNRNNNTKDPEQIKNINININELNIINKEKLPSVKMQSEQNSNMKGNVKNLASRGTSPYNKNSNDSEKNIYELKNNLKSEINKLEEKKIILAEGNDSKIISSTVILDNNKIENDERNSSNLINKNTQKEFADSNEPSISDSHVVKSEKPADAYQSSTAFQKLSKLKSLKINLNINQLKKMKNQENKDVSINESQLEGSQKLHKDIALEEEEESNKLKYLENKIKIFQRNPDKIESDLSGSESNSRGATPPKRNTPKFTSENNNFSYISDLLDDSYHNEVFNESYMTKIIYKHQNLNDDSFVEKAQDHKDVNLETKKEFNPIVNNNRGNKDIDDAGKFSFQNDLKENTGLCINKIEENYDKDDTNKTEDNTGNTYRYVKPKVGFKKNLKAKGKYNIYVN